MSASEQVLNLSNVLILIMKYYQIMVMPNFFLSFLILNFLLPVILITGGYKGSEKLATIYNTESSTSCEVTSLPEERFYHTQHGNKVCGGGRDNTMKTCIQWQKDEAKWVQSNTLQVARINHVSWTTDAGTYLIGGNGQEGSELSTELVKDDGTTETGFELKYKTR